MLKPDIVVSAFAISVFLIIYYIAVGFFPVYFQTIFGFSQQDANGLGNWNWAFNALALLIVGFISDKVRVRKPFMVVGAIGAIVMTIIFLTRATHPDTSYYTFVVIVSLLRGLARHRVRAVDGELHRDRRAPQSGAHRDRPGRLGPGHPHRHRGVGLHRPARRNTVTTLVDKGAPVQCRRPDDPTLTAAQNAPRQGGRGRPDDRDQGAGRWPRSTRRSSRPQRRSTRRPRRRSRQNPNDATRRSRR